MTRTTIKKTDNNEVTITAIDPMTGEMTTRAFWIPTSGGYVREGDNQVCERLSNRGNTLRADDVDDLLSVIRHEWKAYRAEAIRDEKKALYGY